MKAARRGHQESSGLRNERFSYLGSEQQEPVRRNRGKTDRHGILQIQQRHRILQEHPDRIKRLESERDSEMQHELVFHNI